MKAIGFLLMVGSIFFGLYVGVYLGLYGGVVQIISGFTSIPVSPSQIAIGVIRFMLASPCGAIAGYFMFLFGAGLAYVGK